MKYIHFNCIELEAKLGRGIGGCGANKLYIVSMKDRNDNVNMKETDR